MRNLAMYTILCFSSKTEFLQVCIGCSNYHVNKYIGTRAQLNKNKYTVEKNIPVMHFVFVEIYLCVLSHVFTN